MMTKSNTSLRALFCLLAVASLVAVACDDDGPTRPPPGGGDLGTYDAVDTSTTTDTGTTDDVGEDTGDAGEDADDASDVEVTEPGPVVAIESPAAASDPVADALVTTDRLTVDCRVVGNADGTRVDAESVTIDLTDADGTTLSQTATSTVSTTLFSAEFDLSALPNGPLTLTCSASDRGEPVVTNSDTVETFLDLGPRITVLVPEANTAYSQQLDVVFRVEPDPVVPGDAGAAVDDTTIVATIGNTTIPGLMQDANGNYVTSFEFDDPMLFDPPLDGAALFVVEAANMRASGAVTRTAEVPFRADDTGPAITFVTPQAGDLVGGLFELRVKVNDPAGVNSMSVRATVANTITRTLQSVGNGEYAVQVDARGLDTDIVSATINVTASDTAGNEVTNGVTVTLDVHEPVLDLDSVGVREFNTNGQCSRLFDPLGSDTPNDLDTVPQQFELRARIEDIGNGSDSTGTVNPKAGVADATVRVYIIDDTNQALTVDSNADGVCDRVNPNVVGATVLDLVPVAPRGGSWFNTALGGEPLFGETPTVADADCEDSSSGAEAPPALCGESSPLSRVIKDEIATDPVIYAIPPLTMSNCVGGSFDALGANFQEGWMCAVVRAEDRLGNLGVSRPLRLCFERNDSGACDSPGPAPDCTGTFDPMTAIDDPAADCTPAPSFESYPWRNVRRNF